MMNNKEPDYVNIVTALKAAVSGRRFRPRHLPFHPGCNWQWMDGQEFWSKVLNVGTSYASRILEQDLFELEPEKPYVSPEVAEYVWDKMLQAMKRCNSHSRQICTGCKAEFIRSLG